METCERNEDDGTSLVIQPQFCEHCWEHGRQRYGVRTEAHGVVCLECLLNWLPIDPQRWKAS